MFGLVEMVRLVRRREFLVRLAPQPVIAGRHYIVDILGQQRVPIIPTAIVEQPRLEIEELLDFMLQLDDAAPVSYGTAASPGNLTLSFAITQSQFSISGALTYWNGVRSVPPKNSGGRVPMVHGPRLTTLFFEPHASGAACGPRINFPGNAPVGLPSS